MEATLIAADLWDVVGPEEEDVIYKGPKGLKEKKKKQQQARAKIVLEISVSQLPFVMGMVDPRQMWDTLETVHRSVSVNSILSLRRSFFRMTKLESESIMTWISRVRARAIELSNTPCPASDLDIILVITDGLPPVFETVVSALDGLPFDDLTISNVITRISGHESHLARIADKSTHSSPIDDPVAMVAASNSKRRTRKMKCYSCGGIGHVSTQCPSQSDECHLFEDQEEENVAATMIYL